MLWNTELFPTNELSEQLNIHMLYQYLGEELMHWGLVYKLPVVSLRFFNVYGIRSRTSGTYGAVFGVFLAQKLAKNLTVVVMESRQEILHMSLMY